MKISWKEKNYEWGSKTLIPKFQHRFRESEIPVAEIWFGAHPSDSSFLGETSLHKLIAERPLEQLGTDVQSRFGSSLPFQVKLLAAASPLSIQVHPSLEQAKRGFAREEAEGIPINSPVRNYKDPNHKPELLLAMTSFSALVGLRPHDEVVSILDAFNLRHLRETFEADGFKAAFEAILSPRISNSEIGFDKIQEVLIGTNSQFHELFQQTREILPSYPADRGLLCTLLMNRIDLEPGEAIFIDAKQLHAYISGLGVEVMANSDNVLRGGLTSKHVDVPELLETVNWDSSFAEKLELDGNSFASGIDDFKVSIERIVGPCWFHAEGPKIVLCIDGSFSGLNRGEALWVPAKKSKFRLIGDGKALIVTAGIPVLKIVA